MQLPVLFRNELADLTFALDNQAHGHRLNPPRGKAAGDLGPQQRRNHVAHDTVQETTGLLGIDPIGIQIARAL